MGRKGDGFGSGRLEGVKGDGPGRREGQRGKEKTGFVDKSICFLYHSLSLSDDAGPPQGRF